MEKLLPKGWVETELGDVLDIEMGQSPPSYSYNIEGIGTPFMQGKTEFGKTFPTIIKYTTEPKKIVEKGTVLLSVRAPIGPTNIANTQMCIGRGLAGLSSNKLPTNFILYYLRSIESVLDGLGTGTTFKAISGNKIHTVHFPLPPLPEQERIVAKLDKLFAQHEKIKAALDRIPQLLKNFRQQVLTHAVTGKLTEQWRDGKDLEEWKKYTIREISDTRLGKMLDKAKNSGSEYPYLGNIDVQWNEINTDNLKRIRIDDAEFEKFKLAKGDVLVCEGGEAGRAAIWQKEDSNIIFQKALHRVRLYPKFLPEILLYNLELDTKSGRIAELYTGTTIKHLTGQNFAKYVVKYCSVTEQKQIVNRVENLFTKADTIETRYQTLKAKIDSLPQAILHKAFKGELVPQLPTDGDAKDLLAEIMALKKDVKGKKK